jgi:hypothetical protein
MFTVSPKYIAKLKAEFTKLDPALFDKDMWQLCRAINSIPDVATSWCCAGHADTTESGRDGMYVSLHVSTEDAERIIATLYDRWCKFLGTQVSTAQGAFDIHHTTRLEINRLRDKYEAGEVVYTYTLLADVDTDDNTSDRNITALAKSLECLGFLSDLKLT